MNRPGSEPLLQSVARAVLGAYLRVFHRLEWDFSPSLPEHGPILALCSHFSLLDTVAFMVADPYRPSSTFVVKESLARAPLVGWLVRAWGAIPVARAGRDIAAVRRIREVLQRGRSVCIAAEGARTRTGRLGPMHPVLMRLSVDIARRGTPVFPGVQLGTFEALPPGALLPRPHPIKVVVGDPIDLSPWFDRRLTNDDLVEIGRLVQSKIAALLPPERQPAEGTPVLLRN